MKVVLTKDVKGLGSRGDTVEQKDGYALNFLIPKGFAVPEKSSIAKTTIQKKEETAGRKVVQHELLNDFITSLEGETFTFAKKVNEQGGLYDKVGVDEILAKISEERGSLLPESAIALDGPFEGVGEYPLSISNNEVSATVTIAIVAEAS